MAITKIRGNGQIQNTSIEKEQLNANVAGNGLEKTAEANAIAVKLDGATLGVSASGIKISAGGVSPTELASNAVTTVKVADNAIDETKLDETKSYVVAGLALNGSGSNAKITNVADGTGVNDAVNKGQLDSAITGLSWKEPAKYWGDHDGDNGWSLVVGDRVVDNTDHKVYTVTAGSGDGDEVTWDAGVSPSNGWAILITDVDYAITYDGGTSAWVQFTGAGSINAGTGLSKTGNTLNVNLLSTGGLQVTGVDPNDAIGIKLDGATLSVGASGLKIADGGVDTTQLANDAVDDTKLDETKTYTVADIIISNLTASQFVKTDASKKLVSVASITIADTDLSASNGVQIVGGNDIQIDLSNTNPSLEVADGGLRAKVDGTTIERAAGGLQIKAGGITESHLASSVELGFEQNRAVPNESPGSGRTDFSWSFQATIGSEMVFLNGMLQQGEAGDGTSIANDYEIEYTGGATHIYFAQSPSTQAVILMSCRVTGE